MIGKDEEGNVVERTPDWKPIVDDWQGTIIGLNDETQPEESEG